MSIYWRGVAMGAADVVPGVSGGTVALMVGIYDRFIDSLKSIATLSTLNEWRTGQLRQWAIRIDLVFLLTLFAGILTSIIVFAGVITYLIEVYPHPVWSMFIGLILAAAWVMFRDLRQHEPMNLNGWSWLVIGILVTVMIGRMTPQTFEIVWWHYFFAGAFAICAMILPGVSGSFLLLMMGMYTPVLSSIKTVALGPLGLFCAGCSLGLLSFSHLLSFLLHRYPQASHCFLIGLMLGAVEKLWPWKMVVSTRLNSKGLEVPLLESAVTPFEFERMNGISANIEISVFVFVASFLCIILMGKKQHVKP